MTTYINSIGTSNPKHKISQKEISNFMANAFQFEGKDKTKQDILYRASGIQSRYSVLSDYGKDFKDFTFFPNNKNLEPFPDTKHRMEVYKSEAAELAQKACLNCLNNLPEELPSYQITHLITISCTGMHAPGIDIELVEKLKLRTNIERTSINFMGCYAAFNGLKTANYICKSDPSAKVLVVCVEICSIHFQKDLNEDNILSNALFGDGAAAVLLSPNPIGRKNMEISGFYNDLAMDGMTDMAWHIGSNGFEMKLSTFVPDFIQKGIKELSYKLFDKLQLNVTDIDFFAIHPGGKKILEVIENELNIDKQNNRFAYQVLKEYGNMSSPTVLFVIKEIFQILTDEDHGKRILSFAFGPGLTMESMVLKIC
jgi:alpha-pyrone synthase